MNNQEAISIKAVIKRAADSRLASMLLLIALYWMVASASFSGFVGKWGLRDGVAREDIEMMLEGTAYKPFVYRQLAPMIANAASQITPWKIREYVGLHLRPDEVFYKANALHSEPHTPRFRFRYLIVYYTSFISLFLSLFVLRIMALDAGTGKVAATTAPLSLALAFPYLQTNCGFFYDNIELLFLSLAFLMASRGRSLILIALVLPATLNKETFIFFLPALYPLLRLNFNIRKSLALIVIVILTAGIINIILKLNFIDNPGAIAEFHLLHNLSGYFSPSIYLEWEDTYGIVGPGRMSIVTLVIILMIIFRGWPTCSPAIKQHFLIASAINFPIFAVFGATGELRNLSLLFVGFMIVIAFAIERTALSEPNGPGSN